MNAPPVSRPAPLAAALAGMLTIALEAGSFTAGFNDGQLPPSTTVHGNAAVAASGGFNNSGVLVLTRNANSEAGSFLIEDLDGGALVYGFHATFLAQVGGGTSPPADGWSFCVAPDLPDGTFGEAGAGTGFRLGFDTYDNVDGDPYNEAGEAPAINLYVGGQLILQQRVPLTDLINSAFVPVTIALNADGSLDLAINGKTHFARHFFPGYQPLIGPRFGIGARTGGLNAKHFIDDLAIETYLTPVPGVVQQPADLTVIAGTTARFQVMLNNAEGASIQWFRDDVALPGATTDSYTLAAANLADSGARFAAHITLGDTTVATTEATLTVVELDLPAAPVLGFDFNDGQIPFGTQPVGSAYVNAWGGVGDSGVLVLTDALNDSNGSFLVEDPHAGASVYGVAARFRLLLGGGTDVPADGFSFNFAPDLPDTAGMAEEGAGTGLSVTFDTYDNTDANPTNAGGEAPAVGVKFGGAFLADRRVGPDFLRTADGFADVLIRLTADGRVDVAWNGMVLFHRLPVPGFASLSGARFGLYARTGGLNDNHWVDDLELYTYLTADTLRISGQPQTQRVLVGRPALFHVEVNVPAVATYQWYRDGTAISGATDATLIVLAPTLVDNGAQFSVRVSGGGGPAVLSEEAGLRVLDLAPPTDPLLSYDFNNGQLPAGAEIGGSAMVETFGGVNDSGVLQLTLNANELNGGFRSPLIADGAQLLEFTLAADVLAGGGTEPPADGFSLCLGSDLPVTVTGEAENGAGTGVTVAFDTYDNGNGEAPSVDIRYRGQLVASTVVPLALLNHADTFFTVLLRVKETGVLDLAYGDAVIYADLPLPDFVPLNSVRVGAYARTGGLNANHFVDNLRLGATIPQSISIVGEPADVLVLAGQPATFAVQPSNPAGVTYQWRKHGVDISGATQATYTTPALAAADDGAGYSVRVQGPGNTVLSRTALAGVLDVFDAGPNPVFNFDFNDWQVPAGSQIFGHTYVDVFGGVNESGVLKLTINENSQQGAWLVDTPAGVTAIHDFVATWKMRVGGGTDVPADGASFVLGDDVADGSFGESGAGSGLVVSFDTYDNGNGEAPAIDVTYRGNPVATRLLPISVLRTGEVYADLGVRLNRNGTLDLYYGTTAIFHRVPLPAFVPFAAGRFGWGARTGGLNDNHWIDNVRVSLNTQPPETTLGIGRTAGGSVTITWTGGGTLQTAATVLGPWSDVPGASSGYTLPPTTQAALFRVRN
jgi:hypothetical protein